MAKRATHTQETALFELEGATVAVIGALETETEVSSHCEEQAEPTALELERIARREELDNIVTGYSHEEWTDVMLSLDSHNVDMSRGVAAERLFIARHAAKKARVSASQQAREERREELAGQAEKLEKARTGATYRAMSALLPALKSRRVVLTLAGKTVTVDSVSWEKGEGWISSTVATFTVVKGLYVCKRTGSKSVERLDFDNAVQFIKDNSEKRGADIMPRGFRAVMRTHRAKNATPGDVTGNRATRAVALEVSGGDELSAADLEKYPALAMVAGPRLTKTGFENMQGVALTAGERRERDRARLKAWREAKRAEKQAKQA